MAWKVLIESHVRWQVLRRDGHKCVVSGRLDGWSEDDIPPDAIPGPGYVDVVRIFKHPLVVYKEIYDSDKVCALDTGKVSTCIDHCIHPWFNRQAKRKSIKLSMNVLHQYCQLSEKYVQDMGSGVMDDPENLVSLYPTVHVKFDKFAITFIPTKVRAVRYVARILG